MFSRISGLKWLALFSVLVFIGVGLVQYSWFRQALHIADEDFNRRVTAALRMVAQRMLTFNRNPDISFPKTVERIDPEYYTVSVGDVVQAPVLEAYLRQEFNRQGISLDFEYAVFDCQQNRIEYGGFVCSTPGKEDCVRNTRFPFPREQKQNYYFAVYFPQKQQYLLSGMNGWFLSSAILLLVLLLLGFALLVIYRQQRLSLIQADFINNMTHEFKTPLATIAISSEVLSRPDILQSPQRLFRYVHIIRQENHRLQKGVEVILKNALLAQRTRLQLLPLHLHPLLESLTATLEPVLEEKKARLELDLQAQSDRLLADELHLTNLLHNLLDNSLKYTADSPYICLRTWNEGNRLLAEVQDNGQGIPQREQKRIFRQFYRIPTGNVHNVKGFGLGLYYVRQMVKAHKGRLRLKSQPGNTSFTLSFPLV
jgi:two-component system phosphate regulon sensor histidine kinase PhoR